MKIAHIFLLVLWLNNCSQESKDLTVVNMCDFGRVRQADTLKTIFQIRNDLDKNLKIEEAFGSSNQVKIFIDKKSLKPKESASISVEFFTNEVNGPQKRLISIKTDNEIEPYVEYYILAIVQSLDSYRREELFNLINSKKESAYNLPKDFDFSNKYTDKVIRALNLDPEEITANEYYFLSEQEFLKDDIEGFSFQIYYKHFYGNQLEKILRVERPDTTFDITLSGNYSNGMDGSTLSTEFINNFRFKETRSNVRAVSDDQNFIADEIDSIFTYYKYNEKLNFEKDIDFANSWYKEITTNPETGNQDTLIEQMSTLGKIETTELLIGVSHERYSANLPETIAIYSKNKKSRTKLETIENSGAYIDAMELFTFDKNHFVYIKMMETSGNSYSYFFAVDMRTMTLNKVEQDWDNFNIPDSLQIHKGYGITKEADNKFKSGGILRSTSNSYYFEREHRMIKENGKFVLKCISTTIHSTDD